ncbi:hypothetical protein J27TS8_36390 [Robertmurraya siralis]|uniref:Uncharacterized protein n=1 Tax=Robertmurraya siralis TaxID=77777 RepID=A0A919WL08_9BACI|nr:hypothetical protein CHH80_07375 [Bacillus sp. 7504-2]GIN63646.1 hypothetical protein J27TS8_36390 [Robertmurraya siralis]
MLDFSPFAFLSYESFAGFPSKIPRLIGKSRNSMQTFCFPDQFKIICKSKKLDVKNKYNS